MKTLKSEISAVTVYSDRAQITRTAKIKLTAGEHILVFANLPEGIEENSVQVDGKGPGTLSDVRFKVEYLTEVSDASIRKLMNIEQKLKDDIGTLNSKKQRIQSEMTFVKDIANRLTTVTDKSEPAELDPDKWIKLTDFYRSRNESLMAENHQTDLDIREKNKELEKVQNELSDMDYRQNKAEKSVEVLVELKEAGELKLDMSYMLFGVSWYPIYDVRVNTKSRKVKLTYHAMVYQNTGEDWIEADIKLSTALVSIDGAQPQLSPWHIYIKETIENEKGRIAAYKEENSKLYPGLNRSEAMTNMHEATFDDEGLEQPIEDISMPSAEVESKTTSVEFSVSGKNNIHSDNQSHKLSIMMAEMDGHFRYSAAPKLSPYAYLKVKATNKTKYPFLAGKSNIFMDNHFVSTAIINLTAPGEEFWTFLGVDEGMKVEHKFINKYQEDVGIFNKSKKTTFTYKIEITNNKTTAEELVVWDQIPVSTNERIKVELIEPIYKKDSSNLKMNEHNYLEWFYKIDPEQKIELPLKFSVEYPKSENIRGIEK